MNETEILQGARELLSDPKRWNKGGSDRGDTYCVLGAMAIASGEANRNAFWGKWKDTPLASARRLLESHIPTGEAAWVYNDENDTTHQDILNLLDKTLADLGALA